VGDGEKLLTYLNSALKVLSVLDIFPRGTKKKLNFVEQCNLIHFRKLVTGLHALYSSMHVAKGVVVVQVFGEC
jgi:hypothetical protein